MEVVAENLISSTNPVEERKNHPNNFFFGWIKDNYDKVFLIVLILAFILRLAVFLKTQNQALWWDEADYLSKSKEWGLNLDIRDLWYYRRGFLWALLPAGSFFLGFGEMGVRFLQVLLSTGIVAVSYFLIKELFDKKLALLTTITLSFSWVFLFFTGHVLSDTPATFFLIVSALFFVKSYSGEFNKKYFYIFAFFFALTILTRMQYLVFTFIFLAYVFFREGWTFIKNKHLWTGVLIFLLIMSPHIFFYSVNFGNPITDILNYYFGIGGISQTGEVGGERVLSNIFDYILDLPYILTLPIFFAFLVGALIFFMDLFIGLDRLRKDELIRKKLFTFLWIFVPLLVLGYITEYVEQRYASPVLPFILLLPSFLFLKLGEFGKSFNLNNRKIIVISMIALICLSIPGFNFSKTLISQKLDSYIEVKNAGLWIKENSLKTDIIISDSLPQIQYYSERSTYPFDLSKAGDSHKATREEFEKFMEENHPRYIVMSSFERYADWANQYMQDNSEKLTPVKAYSQENQPVLIIYQVSY